MLLCFVVCFACTFIWLVVALVLWLVGYFGLLRLCLFSLVWVVRCFLRVFVGVYCIGLFGLVWCFGLVLIGIAVLAVSCV